MEISSSFVVVRRRRRKSYYSYAIRKTSQKIQIKQINGGGGLCFFSFNGDGQLAKKTEKRRGPKKKTKRRWKKKT
jgi:hypothetical protein